MKIRWFTYCGNFWEHSLFYFVQMAFEGKVAWFCSVLAHLWQYAISIIALTDQQMQWSNAGSKAVKNPSNSLTIQGADVILALTVSYSKNTICDSGSKILSLWQWTIFLMVKKEPLKTDFFLMSDFARQKERTEYKNSVHQKCEWKTQEWKMQCYADEGRTFLPTHALTVKEVRKSSFTLPDKTAISRSAKIFQATNHFRNLASTLTSSGNQPLVFLRNTHFSCNQMSQTASRSFIPGNWPTQKPGKKHRELTFSW